MLRTQLGRMKVKLIKGEKRMTDLFHKIKNSRILIVSEEMQYEVSILIQKNDETMIF